MKTKEMLRIGDSVMWRGSWGRDMAKEVKITEIEIGCGDGKHGTEVSEVSWDTIKEGGVVVTLDNNHWAYGYQLDELPK